MNLLSLSWKNLINKPLAMMLSLILFALGIGLISLLFLLEKQLQDNFEKNLAGIDLVIGAKGSPLQLILSSMYHIDAPTGNISLQEARPFLNPQHPLIEQSIPLSVGDSYRGYRIVGTTTDFLQLYQAQVDQGRIWEKNFEVTAGAVVAANLGLKLGHSFQSSHGLIRDDNLIHEDGQAFKVVGILQPTGTVVDQLILTTTQSLWLVHEHGEEHAGEEGHEAAGELPASLLEEDADQEITSLLVRFKGRNYQALNMQRNINENTDLLAATPAIEINRLFSLMDRGERALQILAIVITIVSGLSIFISLFSTLKDRQYELALMRVLGAGPSKLFLLIIMEGLLLAIVGALLGLLLSHVSMQLIGAMMEDNYRYSFTGLQFLPVEWLLLAGALVIGFLAAVLPAIKASRTDIAETLSEA